MREDEILKSMVLNITANYLCLSSALHSPLLTSTKSSASYSLSNCNFKHSFNCLYRSSSSLVKERIQIKKSKISFFLATPFNLSPDYKSQIIDTRIVVTPSDLITSLTIVDCTFNNIISDDRGAAIRIANHVSLILNGSQFFDVVSRYEAAILFVLIAENTWSLEPININRCTFENCYSTGENFKILDDYSEKYPSVLIHEYLGFRYTSIVSYISEISATNCQENKHPMKRFGAYIHHHANTFQLSSFNCTNVNKIDSSLIFFSQAHKQASNVNFIKGIGQAGYALIEIKDIQSTDQLTFQYFDLYNSTLFTEELVTSGNKTEYIKTNYGIIDFGGDYSGSVVFIYCHFYSIVTDSKSLQPILSFSSNGRLPIFANCFTDSESIANEQGFTYGTPFQPTIDDLTVEPTPIITESPTMTPVQTSVIYIPSEVVIEKNNNKNIIVVSVSILATIIVTISGLIIARKRLDHHITYIDETDDSTYGNKELAETINPDVSTHDVEEPYVE